MLSALFAVLMVGTLAGSIEAGSGDGCYRTSCYPTYDRGHYGGCGGYNSYAGCGDHRGYPGYGGYGGYGRYDGYGGCGGYSRCGSYGSYGAYDWSAR